MRRRRSSWCSTPSREEKRRNPAITLLETKALLSEKEEKTKCERSKANMEQKSASLVGCFALTAVTRALARVSGYILCKYCAKKGKRSAAGGERESARGGNESAASSRASRCSKRKDCYRQRGRELEQLFAHASWTAAEGLERDRSRGSKRRGKERERSVSYENRNDAREWLHPHVGSSFDCDPQEGFALLDVHPQPTSWFQRRPVMLCVCVYMSLVSRSKAKC